jgi:hypothetical protein
MWDANRCARNFKKKKEKPKNMGKKMDSFD